jgi:hypothetical protein
MVRVGTERRVGRLVEGRRFVVIMDDVLMAD